MQLPKVLCQLKCGFFLFSGRECWPSLRERRGGNVIHHEVSRYAVVSCEHCEHFRHRYGGVFCHKLHIFNLLQETMMLTVLRFLDQVCQFVNGNVGGPAWVLMAMTFHLNLFDGRDRHSVDSRVVNRGKAS